MTEVAVLFFSLSIPVLLLATARICSVSLWVSPLLFVAIQVMIGVSAKGLLYVFQPSFSSRLDFGFEEDYMLTAFLYISLFIIMFLGATFGSREE